MLDPSSLSPPTTFPKILGNRLPTNQISSLIKLYFANCSRKFSAIINVVCAEVFLGSSILTWNIFLSFAGKKSCLRVLNKRKPTKGKTNEINIARRGLTRDHKRRLRYFFSRVEFEYPFANLV